jgi:hypothetical protein
LPFEVVEGIGRVYWGSWEDAAGPNGSEILARRNTYIDNRERGIRQNMIEYMQREGRQARGKRRLICIA